MRLEAAPGGRQEDIGAKGPNDNVFARNLAPDVFRKNYTRYLGVHFVTVTFGTLVRPSAHCLDHESVGASLADTRSPR